MPNENDCEKMQKLKTDISKDEKLNALVKSYNRKDEIIFYAGQEKENSILELFLKPNNLLTIASYNGQIDKSEVNGMSRDQILKKAREFVIKARREVGKDSSGSQEDKNPIKKEKNKRGKNNTSEKEDDIIAEVLEECVSDLSALDNGFWKNRKHNPWWTDEEHNPGIETPFYNEKTYILSCDFENIKKYIGNGGKMVQSNVLPQPYIGDPNAPIWLLLMNPSYSKADVYDMVSCDETAKKEVIASIKKVYKTDKEVNELKPYFFMENSEFQLDARKDLMRQQLSFTSTKFYVLEPEFHTVRAADEIAKTQNKVVRKDSSCQGSYEWWNKYLLQQDICNKKHDNLKNFFVLESFPYHSENYDKTLRPKVEHFKFWVKMVLYALLSKKILLCRESIGELVINVASQIRDFDLECAKKERIFVSSSSGSFSVSTGNFFSYKTWQEIQDSKKDFKKMIIKMIENK